MNQKNEGRNYLFDNIRGILIFLVVMGHLLRHEMGVSNFIKAIYFFIYLFHMPAFIFITGYFSKHIDKCRRKAVQGFFLPYIVINTFFWGYEKFILRGEHEAFRVLTPQWGMWFFLAVFVWKMLLTDFVRIRFILPLSIAVGLLSGYSSEFGSKLSLARILAFLPFFLLGFYMNETHIDKIRKIPKFICSLIIVCYAGISYVVVRKDIFSMGNFYMKECYDNLTNVMISGVFTRMYIYVSATIITFCLINLLSTKKTFLSTIGKNSITVYVIHLFIIMNLDEIELPWSGTKLYLLFALVAAALISYVCSRHFVLSIYNYLMNGITTIFIKDK